MFEQELGAGSIRIWTCRDNYRFSSSTGEGVKSRVSGLSHVEATQKPPACMLESFHLLLRVSLCPSLPCSVLWEDATYLVIQTPLPSGLQFCLASGKRQQKSKR